MREVKLRRKSLKNGKQICRIKIMPGLKYILPLVFTAVTAPLFALSDTTKTQTFTDSISYTCPMHPEVISDRPGKCPKCGMDLIQKISSSWEHSKNMMMCPMHGMVDMDHKHDDKKQSKRMMKGMGIAMGAMMVVMMIIVGNH